MNFVKVHGGITLCALLVGGVFSPAIAETIGLQPVADTTLVEAAPDNNLGGVTFVNAGKAGANGAGNRGLYRFDFSSLPPNSKIKSASVTLEVTTEPNGGGESSIFELHRMLRSWGEGNKNSSDVGSPGLGFPASTNEATWNSPFAFTTNTWTAPGASGDFAAAPSSAINVYGVDFYEFASPQMAADIQGWLGDPASNFGWLLKTESESTTRTARRFGSREFVGEDTTSPPRLVIEFVAPPALERLAITNGHFRFSFLAETDSAYRVEFKSAFNPTNSWLTLTNIPAPNESLTVLVSDVISASTRFYRVIPE